MDTTKKATIALLARLLVGTASAVLPDAAAAGPAIVRPAAPVSAQSETARVRTAAAAAKPLVMLVCREVRGGRRGEAARSTDLSCVTRWAGF